MTALDWFVVVAFLGGVVAVGVLLSRRASGSMEDFFVSGRNLPWWLAGTSILATSFSSDTPLHTTRVIREAGLGGAWFYWSGILSGLIVAFFFARLWRRAGIITDAELIELRYSGAPAAALRGTIALFRSMVLELITLAWVILGMTKTARAVLDLPDLVWLPGLGAVGADVVTVVGLVVLALAYAASSGLWGVVVTDFIEFIVAMGGAVVLAVIAVGRVGGAAGLREQLAAGPLGQEALVFLPTGGTTAQLPTVALAVYVGVQWWANTEIDGSGKRAQRFLACRDERHALASGVWNMAVQWIIRSWPWYLAALASVVLLPDLTDHEAAYPRLIAELMPTGLKGLMVAAFLAAFLSTVDSQLNLSASYLVNDLYRRFLVRRRAERHYVHAARAATVVVAALATALALALPSLLDAFRFKMELMAGLGLVYVLRWFWWRVTAWTEIAALVVGVCTTVVLHLVPSLGGSGTGPFAWRLLIIVGAASAAALVATLALRPEPTDTLRVFYRRVRPPALLWGPVARLEADARTSTVGLHTVAQYLLAVVSVFSGMFAVGKLTLGEPAAGLGLLVLALVTGGAMLRWAFRQPCG